MASILCFLVYHIISSHTNFDTKLSQDQKLLLDSRKKIGKDKFLKAETDYQYSGSCGDKCTFLFEPVTGKMTISGSGRMTDYSDDDTNPPPWYQYRTEVKTLIIDSGITFLGSYSFFLFEQITEVTIPNTVKEIGDVVFEQCSQLQKINIPEGVPQLGRYLLCDCSSLSEITIPNSVTRIRNNCFYLCTKLQTIIIPNSVLYIEDYVFQQCQSLQTITLSTNLISLGISVFNGCFKLKSINIPSGIKYIFGNTFCQCYSLEEIVIPNSIQSIGNLAFYRCYSLKSFEIPSSVTTIQDRCFEECTSLTSFIFNNSPKEIPDRFFSSCINLKSIIIPNSVKSIGEMAFKNCSSITKIIFPDQVTEIKKEAFKDCKLLQSIIIPGSVTSVGNSAFENCYKLDNVQFDGITEPTYGDKVFSSCGNLHYIDANPSYEKDTFIGIPIRKDNDGDASTSIDQDESSSEQQSLESASEQQSLESSSFEESNTNKPSEDCTEYDPNCIECPFSTCSKCNEGFQLQDGKCYEKSTCSISYCVECAIKNDDYICLKCKNNYSLSSDGKYCLNKNILGCSKIGCLGCYSIIHRCESCDSEKNFTETPNEEGICICKDGYKFYNNKCVPSDTLLEIPPTFVIDNRNDSLVLVDDEKITMELIPENFKTQDHNDGTLYYVEVPNYIKKIIIPPTVLDIEIYISENDVTIESQNEKSISVLCVKKSRIIVPQQNNFQVFIDSDLRIDSSEKSESVLIPSINIIDESYNEITIRSYNTNIIVNEMKITKSIEIIYMNTTINNLYLKENAYLIIKNDLFVDSLIIDPNTQIKIYSNDVNISYCTINIDPSNSDSKKSSLIFEYPFPFLNDTQIEVSVQNKANSLLASKKKEFVIALFESGSKESNREACESLLQNVIADGFRYIRCESDRADYWNVHFGNSQFEFYSNKSILFVTDNEPQKKHTGLEKDQIIAIIGIVVGCVVAIIIIILLVYFLVIRKRKLKRSESTGEEI